MPRTSDEGIERSANIDRRGFVVAASGIMIGAAMGCADGGGPNRGTIRVRILGFVGTPPSAGTAQVTGANIAPVNITLPGLAEGQASVPVGTYQVVYAPPSGYTVAPGESDSVTVEIVANETTDVEFTVEQELPPSAVIFSSDWSTALGTTAAAVQDTGKSLPWSLRGGQGLEVISSAGLDFPTANVLRVTAVAATTGYAFLRKTGMPIPGVGQSRFYRWYIRVTTPDGLEDHESHPIQDGNAASQCNWLFHIYHDAGAGMWRPQVRPAGAANPFPNNRWFGPPLSKGATYRFEMQIQRTGTTTFQMHVRIYDSAGALLHSDAAFTNEQNTATLANDPTFTFLNVDALDGLNAGCNGIAGSPPWPFVYSYQGGFAVGSVDWIGPYAGGI